MTDARMLDFPGSSIRLVKDVENLSVDHAQFARMALTAAFTMSRNLCIPLSMEVSTAYWEAEFDLPVDAPTPPRESGMLRRSALPERVTAEPRLQNEQVIAVDDISETAALEFVEGFLNEPPNDGVGFGIGWQEIQFNASMARLPDDYPREDSEVLHLEVVKGVVNHPVESHGGAHWVYGPIGASVVNAPFEYRLHRNPGELVLDFSTYWSIWAPGGPGRPEVDSNVEALLKDGWELD
ncbi:hypothetical protein [Streptomyces sp. N2A]|uniref:hypothetical protein n=1 Tax=Streptomyces sp. N2A TaxID=3073936 RepID=UPI00287073DB|nr:hypothetical protein [Streptomyces sp. N2A]